jgi:uncharacterized protein YjbJ (UPF0337 family)
VAEKGETSTEPDKEGSMGWLDKILGRSKKAAGDMTGDSSMRREGMAQEREGMAEERAEMHEEAAMESREEAAERQAEREGM